MDLVAGLFGVNKLAASQGNLAAGIARPCHGRDFLTRNICVAEIGGKGNEIMPLQFFYEG